MKASLIYPHQLSIHPDLFQDSRVLYLVEDPLFFSHYQFHRQKLMLHRSSMKRLEHNLTTQGQTVRYIEFHQLADSAAIGALLADDGVTDVILADVTDDWLSKKICRGLAQRGISLKWLPSNLFITPQELAHSYRPKKSDFYFFNDFYIWQRRRTGILMEKGKPVGGRWSFDDQNRERLPRNTAIPNSDYIENSLFAHEAARYVDLHFSDNPGGRGALRYPDSPESSTLWLERFFKERFSLFGPYEDAISHNQTVLFHSLLTPALNIGLLDPNEVIRRAAAVESVPFNSLEGFIRQIIGWREFVRIVYEQQGGKQRTCNSLVNNRSMPTAFYTGETGVAPVDTVIERIIECGYCHHIERLMVLGNFMLLCDIHPDQVYRWFMELFIDAYDWVMVPNIYGMSQYADGGLMTTKPYISGSSYIVRMSSFAKGSWCEIWDALYWRFVDRHLELIRTNPRMSVMASMRDKLHASGKLQNHLTVANRYLEQLL